MFCRYCGAHIADDSQFCAKCGKRLGVAVHPRLEKWVAKLRLKTPYPYFIVLFVLFVAWAIGPRRAHADYSNIKWSIELDKKLDIPQNNVYLQQMSLVLENTGQKTLGEIPIDLVARIEPRKPAEVEVEYKGRKFVVLFAGKPVPSPLGVILADSVAP